jgi:hypothetical protein
MVEIGLTVNRLTQAIFAGRPHCSVRIPAQPDSAGQYFRQAILRNPFDSILGAHPNGTV